MNEETLAQLLRSRTEFLTRYLAAHPDVGTECSDALTAAFSAGVTTALNLATPAPGETNRL